MAEGAEATVQHLVRREPRRWHERERQMAQLSSTKRSAVFTLSQGLEIGVLRAIWARRPLLSSRCEHGLLADDRAIV